MDSDFVQLQTDRKYFDIEGNHCTLRQMIRREPDWVESRFRHMEKEVARLTDAIELLREDRDNLKADKAYLMAEIDRKDKAIDIALEHLDYHHLGIAKDILKNALSEAK